MAQLHEKPTIVIRGAGDIASGVALRLYRAGFTRMLLLECAVPLAVRRTVSFCEAVHEESTMVEDVQGVLLKESNSVLDCAKALQQALNAIWDQHHMTQVPVLVDPEGKSLSLLRPHIFIDATLRKRAIDVNPSMADLVLALGPGFLAPEHAHAVIETMRGHHLGRVIRYGGALPNTGIPGPVGGLTLERLLRAPLEGIFRTTCCIGQKVVKGQAIAYVEEMPSGTACGRPRAPEETRATLRAGTSGVIRGLLRDGTYVSTGLKVGDVDPRKEADWTTVSEKALAVGGGVLEAVCAWWMQHSTHK